MLCTPPLFVPTRYNPAPKHFHLSDPLWKIDGNKLRVQILSLMLEASHSIYYHAPESDSIVSKLQAKCKALHPELSFSEAMETLGLRTLHPTLYHELFSDTDDTDMRLLDSAVGALSTVNEVNAITNTILNTLDTNAPQGKVAYQLVQLHSSLSKLGRPLADYTKELEARFESIRGELTQKHNPQPMLSYNLRAWLHRFLTGARAAVNDPSRHSESLAGLYQLFSGWEMDT
eukprot:Sspe_Gene.115475::Locus_103008_Transcript_1_1_Confidence_1.000_Length_775::g.115475::m.115475